MPNSLPGFAVTIDGKLCLPAFGTREAAADHAMIIVSRMLAEDGALVSDLQIEDVTVTLIGR